MLPVEVYVSGYFNFHCFQILSESFNIDKAIVWIQQKQLYPSKHTIPGIEIVKWLHDFKLTFTTTRGEFH